MKLSTRSTRQSNMVSCVRAFRLRKIKTFAIAMSIGLSLALLPVLATLGGTNVSSTASFSQTGEAIGYTVDSVSLSNAFNNLTTCTLTSTRNFSITLPTGATVKQAILYWATDLSGGDSAVSLAGQTVSASQSWNDTISTTTYNGYRADVTSRITGSGSYSFGGLSSAATNPFKGGCLSGATLIVIYDTTRSDPNALNRIEIFDGFQGIRGAGLGSGGTNASVTLPINSSGIDLSFMTALSWQGNSLDENPTAPANYQDSLTVNGTAVSNTNNPINDQGNGSGANKAKNSVYAVDADTFDISSILGGASSLILKNTSVDSDYVISQGFILGSRGPDVSDAPNNSGYSYGVARHKIVPSLNSPSLYLGSTVDGEVVDNTYVGSINANYDDSNGVDDEDGITLPTLNVGVTSYSIPVSNIKANGTGTLHAWVDFNKNGTFDSGEYTSVTVTNGTPASALSWSGVTAGAAGNTYARFRFSTDTSINASTPSGLANDGEVEDYLLPIVLLLDYGDAPTSLTTIDAALTNTYLSASHVIDGLTYLGDRVDADAANQPNLNADGDDTNGSANDEDGVTFPLAGTTRVLSSGQSNTLDIKASRTGILNAWIDWNQDGDWDDAGEQIATNANLTAGNNSLTVTVLNTAPHGATYARFRFSTTSGLGSTGATTANGEVEDYKVNIVLPAPVACNSGILNNGFEQPVIPASPDNGTPPILQDFGFGRIVNYREADVPWWGTISNSPSAGTNFNVRNAIELWNKTQTAVSSARPFEGNQFAEINANVDGRLYQDLAVPPGSIIRWQVAHRGRDGDDILGVLIGSPDSEISQGNYTTPNTEWRVYSGIYTVPSGQFITRFALKAVSAKGGITKGNFVDDIRLSNFCAPTVKGYKSVKLTTDADNNSKISPGDTLTYTLYYANTTGAGTGPAAGFQINDPLPSGLTITAAGAQTITVSGGNTSANINPNYTGAASGVLSNLLNPGALLDVGGVVRIDIPVKVGTTASGTLLNQGTSFANEFSAQNVKTDNADNTNAGLPTGVTIPPSSVVQSQTLAVDPTQVTIINPAVSNNPNLILVKRITAVRGGTTTLNGDNLAIYNQDDTYPYDDNEIEPSLAPKLPDFPTADTNKWPLTTGKTSSTFLIGGQKGGTTKPGEEVEYTIYFLSTGNVFAKNVTICDRIPRYQTFVPNAFNNLPAAFNTGTAASPGDRGIAVFQGSTTNPDTIYSYTNIGDGDAARYYPPGSPLPSACTQPALAEDNGTIVVNLGDVPNALTPGTPKESYGFLRFRAKVK